MPLRSSKQSRSLQKGSPFSDLSLDLIIGRLLIQNWPRLIGIAHRFVLMEGAPRQQNQVLEIVLH